MSGTLACLLLVTARLQESGAGMVLDVGVALTMNEQEVIHNARILIENGKIKSIGRQSEVVVPDTWIVLEYPRSFAFPGGVDLHSHSHTGSWVDINDSVHPDNPELRTLDVIDAGNHFYQTAIAGGVTTVNAIPGSGSNLSGAGTLLKLKDSKVIDEVVMRFPGSVKVAQGYNPERDGGDLGNSRMGMWWMLRWWLDRGREVAAGGRPDLQPDVESITGILAGHYPFLVHTAGARDTYGTVRMFQLEAQVPVVVSHASFNGHFTAPDIAQTGAHLNVGPRNFDFRYHATAKFLGLVDAYEKGGNQSLSVQTDSNVVPLEEFFFQATLAERLGCSTWTALESINVDPARQILAEDRIGRLLPGLDADIVIKAGQPLDPRTPVELVLIDGVINYDIRDGQKY